MTYTCLEDNLHTKTEAIPKNSSAHTVVADPAVQPTCKANGKTEGSHCSECNKVITTQQTVPALNHEWNDGVVTKEATCTEAGIKTFTCSRDGSHTRVEAIPKLGHSYLSEVVPPTEEDAGYTKYTCSTCGDDGEEDEDAGDAED